MLMWTLAAADVLLPVESLGSAPTIVLGGEIRVSTATTNPSSSPDDSWVEVTLDVGECPEGKMFLHVRID